MEKKKLDIESTFVLNGQDVKYKDMAKYFMVIIMSNNTHNNVVIKDNAIHGVFKMPFDWTKKSMLALAEIATHYDAKINIVSVGAIGPMSYNEMCEIIASNYPNFDYRNDGQLVSKAGNLTYNKLVSHILYGREATHDSKVMENIDSMFSYLDEQDISDILSYIDKIDPELINDFDEIESESEFVLSRSYLTWTNPTNKNTSYVDSIFMHNTEFLTRVSGNLIASEDAIKSLDPLENIKEFYATKSVFELFRSGDTVYEKGREIVPSPLAFLWLYIENIVKARKVEYELANLNTFGKVRLILSNNTHRWVKGKWLDIKNGLYKLLEKKGK